MKPIYFISDLHLSADEPETVALFERFCQDLAPAADAVYILGDFFEYWAGDDDLDDPFNTAITTRLRALADAGVRLFLLHGNRDFLLGPAFAERAGVTLLADPCAVEIAGRKVLLSHGDALCTDDVEYQRFRQMVRNPAWLQQVLAQPLAARKALIAQIRQKSEMAKQTKAAGIMDVNREAVLGLFRELAYLPLIHGHTHRPARHWYSLDDHACERIVLPDWYQGHGGYLRVDDAGWLLCHYGLEPERAPRELFETERCIVRELTRGDFDAFHALCSDARLMSWMGDGEVLAPDITGQWIERSLLNYDRQGYGAFAVVDRQSGVLRGFIGIASPTDGEPELIYAVHADHWGQGLATEVGRAFLDYCHHNWGFDTLLATIAVGNLPSRRIAEKLGFVLEREGQDDDRVIAHYRWHA
ncbi:UDP-2,3-diacylglucosamine diphosphatase [Chitinivorax sp. PXF-14]|uniref:UDP-2,3-diacylglucosamine diphosphatase n=1 Tax=Chitinivorax sp. PXF-14 TaxID=3230488 RepID=UPI0034661C51